MVNERLVGIATNLLTQLRGHNIPIKKTRFSMYDFCDWDETPEEIDEAVAVAVKELNKNKDLPPLTS